MPAGYLPLKLRKLIVPQLDLSLSEERPSLDGLKSLLVLCTSEPVFVKVHISLRDCSGTLSNGVFPGPIRRELSQGHLLRGHICKVSLQRKTILKQSQAKTAYNSF